MRGVVENDTREGGPVSIKVYMYYIILGALKRSKEDEEYKKEKKKNGVGGE